MTEFFDSDRNLVLKVVSVIAVVMLGVGALIVAYPSPPILHQTVKVTSLYQYNTALFSSGLGTVSSLVEDIRVNMTTTTYALSCTFYRVNDTLTMINYNGNTGISYSGAHDKWIFDNLHIGCEVFAVQ
jgi:hypothetical protein